MYIREIESERAWFESWITCTYLDSGQNPEFLFEYLQLLYTTTQMYVVFDHFVFRAMSVGNEDAMAFFRGDEILCY